MKDSETAEQKRARRLAKKQTKEEKRQKQERVPMQTHDEEISTDMLGEQQYDTSKFTWHKKYQDLENKGISRAAVMRQEASMRKENELELEKVRRAREQREAEREMLTSERDLQLRSNDDELFSKWISQEDKFHFEQAKRRSEIRVSEGRGKPVDYLSIYVYGSSEPVAQTVQLPFAVVAPLSPRDLEELIAEMKDFQRLEQNLSALEFWSDMLVIAEHEYKEKRAEAVRSDPTISAAERRALESGINTQVKESVLGILRGKSIGELDTLEAEIRRRLSSANAFDDSTYWHALLTELTPQRARARLRAAHPARVQAALTGGPRGDDGGAASASAAGVGLELRMGMVSGPPPSAAAAVRGDGPTSVVNAAPDVHAPPATPAVAAVAALACTLALTPTPAPSAPAPAPVAVPVTARTRSFSPEPVALSEVPVEAVVVEEADDALMLRQAREDVRGRIRSGRLALLPPPLAASAAAAAAAASHDAQGSSASATATGANAGATPALGTMVRTVALDESALALQMYKAEESRGEGPDEEPFNEDYALGNVVYPWASKYKPRKPRFYNRVMSGFEWNQYNRTHYDVENLPPKIVQGYKFNLFFPEIVDRESTPTFTMKPVPDDPEYAILRFSAGPPYQDVAFKIFNLPWLYSRRAGYRCQFDRTCCFQLYFFYRRERYRR